MTKRRALGSEVDVLQGFAFSSGGFSREKGLPLIRIRDLATGTTETNFLGPYSDEYLIDRGDVLIGMDGDFKVVRWSGETALLNQRVCRVRPSTPSLDDGFLFHAIQPEIARVHRLTSQTTVRHLNVRGIRGCTVLDVPLDEQRRIAEILDTIDETIQATDRVIAKLRHAETAVLVDAIDFARADAQLGAVCSLLQDGTHLPPPRTSEGPLLLSVQNLNDGQLQLSTKDTHVPEAFWRSTRRALPIEPGDVCLAVVGTLGKVGVVPAGLPRFTVQRSLTVLRGDPMRMRNDYLFAVMRHGEFQRNLWQRANQTAQPGVYLGELRTVRVPAPPLSEQRRVAGILNTFNEAIRIKKEQRDKLLHVRSGLAVDLLSGRVRTAAP